MYSTTLAAVTILAPGIKSASVIPRGLVQAPQSHTWPPFFKWQQQGAVFEILSLDVTAGEDVAFAHALLRCGTKEEFEKDPDNRLRLTLGLRKQDGRWVVAHEHHSFPLKQ